MRPAFRTEAIVLRRTNYGEADRILSLLTPEQGKVSAIAKGVRKPKSKLAGGLELFAVCDVTVMEGRGTMGLITSARLKDFFGDILHQYERMEAAYMFIKQVNTATETVSEPEFYHLLHTGLESLNSKTVDWQLTELWFRLHFVSLLGHGLNMATDREGNALAAGAQYHYDFAENAFYPHEQGRFNADHIKFLRLVAAKTPAVLSHVGGVEAILDDSLWLVRTLES